MERSRASREVAGGCADSPREDTLDIPFHIPGTTEPAITVRRAALGNISVLVDGRPAKRRHARTMSWDIPLADGSVTELRLTGQWTGLKAIVKGVETALEPRIPRLAVVLMFLPLGLVIVGGLIGALFGVGAAAINARLARRAMGWPLKVAAMLGVTVLAVTLYFGLAFAIAPVPTLTTGNCLNGVREGAELTTDTTRPVDCAIAHENEVVASIPYTGGGAYPGVDALVASAETGCLQGFASYVGVDFQASSLEMILVTPTDVSWLKGDREIDCVVYAPGGAKLTGSIKGSAR